MKGKEMEKSTIDRLATLKPEELKAYQDLISFFDMLGVTTEDLSNIVEMSRNWKMAVDVVNKVSQDQMITNQVINEMKVEIANIKVTKSDGIGFMTEEINYGR